MTRVLAYFFFFFGKVTITLATGHFLPINCFNFAEMHTHASRLQISSKLTQHVTEILQQLISSLFNTTRSHQTSTYQRTDNGAYNKID